MECMIIKKKWLLISLLLISWSTVPFIGMSSIKKYFPAALFMSLFVRGESVLAKKLRWWKFYEFLHPKTIGETPLIWGPFIVGSMWILKWTYGKPLTFLLLNSIVHLLFVFPFYSVFKKLHIFSLVKLSRIGLFGLFFAKAILMYIVQICVDFVRKKNEENSSDY
ncbi:hypothetical protein [Bacillus sp. 2205SS5-2]|uniref:hypothetical protein n=1 Tax=Bacillus sp. 2205SS5-2 TaxID=3109031 RepID=UPI00300701A4